MSHAFQIPGTVIVGGGARFELAGQLVRRQITRILVVTDRHLQQTGVVEGVLAPVRQAGVQAAVFSSVQPDPTIENVQQGLILYRQFQAQAIVALGGGSPIDAGKAIAVLVTNPEPLSQYLGYHNIPRAGVPLIAIPTTAGTGSEVTKVAVITDPVRHVKMMLLDAHLLPKVALVDYELSLTMPRPLTAHVGVDTLTHGIEAYVSRKSHGLTDPLALSCIRLAAEHLIPAWDQPDYHPAREGMMLAACQGGMAFANSSVCLVHGMSRPLGAVYHIPHGLSNAVLLPAVTRFSLPGAPERYAAVSRLMRFCAAEAGVEVAGRCLLNGLEEMNARLQIPRLRAVCGVDRTAFERSLPKLAADALASGSPQNNPVVPTPEEMIQLYREAW